MRFARIVYITAGIWGIAVLTPLFFLIDLTGRPYPPPTSYPHFFYGFLAVAMAWQAAQLARWVAIVARDAAAPSPSRYSMTMKAMPSCSPKS